MILKGKLLSSGSLAQESPQELKSGSRRAANSRVDRGSQTLSRLLVPALIGLVLAAVLFAGGIFSTAKTAERSHINYLDVDVIEAAEQSHYEIKRSYLGKLEPALNSKVGFELRGKLVSVVADEGDRVERGQVLAKLDTQLLKSQFATLTARINNAQAILDELSVGPRQEDIATAKANVQRWHAQLKLAQISRQRVLRLQKSGSVSEQETDESVYDEQTVSAQLAAAKSQLQELVNGTRPEKIAAQRAVLQQLKSERDTIGIQIEKSQLLSPYNGVVASRLLDEGEVIDAGQPVLELFGDGQIEARVGVPVELVDTILSRQEHKLIYSGQDAKVVLKSVRPVKNSDTRTVDVVFRFPERSIEPSFGDVVRLEISQIVDAQGFWIPSAALVETYRGLWGCYVADQTQSTPSLATTTLRELELLHQEDQMSFVCGALRPGERVIASGSHRLVNGQSVRIRTDAESTPNAIALDQN